MDWGSIASAAAGVAGGLAGAFVDHHNRKADRSSASHQFNAQMDESVQRRVADALKAGINPLAALGYNGGATPTIHAGGSSGAGDTFAFVGSQVGKALQAAFVDKQADDMNYDSTMKELDIENSRLRNQYLRNQIDSQTQSPGVDVEPAPSMEGEQLLFTPVYDLKGRPRLVINQNAVEADSDNPGYMSSIINAIGQAMTNGQISPDGRITSSQLRMMLDDFYYNTTGHHIKNLEELYISPTEAATAATMLVRGVS